MLSCPPAIATDESPFITDWAARIIAFSPDPHNILTPQAGTATGRPAEIDAWRAGFWPWPNQPQLPFKEAMYCPDFNKSIITRSQNLS